MKLDDLKVKAKAPEGVINIGFAPHFFDSIWHARIESLLVTAGASHFVNGTEESNTALEYLKAKLSKFLKNKDYIFEIRQVDEIDDLKECLDIVAPDNYESWFDIKKIKSSDSFYVMDFDAITYVIGFLFQKYQEAGVFDYLIANLDDVVKNPNITPITLIDLSNKWHKYLASKRKKKSKSNGGLSLIKIDSYDKAIEESNLLGHCLANSFGYLIENNQYLAYSIRSTEHDGSINAHATIGFTVDRQGFLSLHQMECRGHRTKIFKQEYRNTVFSLFKELFEKGVLNVTPRSISECRYHNFIMIKRVDGKNKNLEIIDPLYMTGITEISAPLDLLSYDLPLYMRKFKTYWGPEITFLNTVKITYNLLQLVLEKTQITIRGTLIVYGGHNRDDVDNLDNLKTSGRGVIKYVNKNY